MKTKKHTCDYNEQGYCKSCGAYINDPFVGRSKTRSLSVDWPSGTWFQKRIAQKRLQDWRATQ